MEKCLYEAKQQLSFKYFVNFVSFPSYFQKYESSRRRFLEELLSVNGLTPRSLTASLLEYGQKLIM